jgi:hypothetical protein
LQKAKSRLNYTNIESTKQVEVASSVDVIKSRKKQNLLLRYFKHLPTFALALFFYFLLFLIFNNFDPPLFKDIILENSYLPILILFFVANFFLFSFIFLNSVKGFIYSFYFLLIIFLKMQSVVFDFLLISSFVSFLVIFEVILKFLSKIFKKRG